MAKTPIVINASKAAAAVVNTSCAAIKQMQLTSCVVANSTAGATIRGVSGFKGFCVLYDFMKPVGAGGNTTLSVGDKVVLTGRAEPGLKISGWSFMKTNATPTPASWQLKKVSVDGTVTALGSAVVGAYLSEDSFTGVIVEEGDLFYLEVLVGSFVVNGLVEDEFNLYFE